MKIETSIDYGDVLLSL